jgi:hypothetical protein
MRIHILVNRPSAPHTLRLRTIAGGRTYSPLNGLQVVIDRTIRAASSTRSASSFDLGTPRRHYYFLNAISGSPTAAAFSYLSRPIAARLEPQQLALDPHGRANM